MKRLLFGLLVAIHSATAMERSCCSKECDSYACLGCVQEDNKLLAATEQSQHLREQALALGQLSLEVTKRIQDDQAVDATLIAMLREWLNLNQEKGK